VTRPLRAAGRLRRAVRRTRPADSGSPADAGERLDSWLLHYYGDRLAAIDRACEAGDGAERFALFRGLEPDLWALLLTQQYRAFPNIRALLPSMPEPELQEQWNGRSGLSLASQSNSFYVRLRARYAQHAGTSLERARVLDFGCGWGRLTRFLARDVAVGHLFGCDPVEKILDVCRATRVPASLARSEFLPDGLPFDEQFDLVYAFSVFTHLSETAHERCLRALYRALRPEALLIVTIRPPAYLDFCEPLLPHIAAAGEDPPAALERPLYLFAAHPASPHHPQCRGDDEIDYGETVITMAYVRERWSELFAVLDVDLLVEDPYQVMLTLRRR